MSDVTQVNQLLHGIRGSAVVGDKGYDSEAILEMVSERGMAAVIPARSSRRVMRPLDTSTYSARNLIERWFGRLKLLRRVATRYEKTKSSFASMVSLASSLVALTGWPA